MYTSIIIWYDYARTIVNLINNFTDGIMDELDTKVLDTMTQ